MDPAFESSRLGELPEFDNPPVVETVLSVQFDPIPNLRTAHLGLLWDSFRNAYPNTEEKLPLDPAIEQFPDVPATISGVNIQTGDAAPVPRLWFVSPSAHELIQIQNGRFIRNWRKQGGGDQYPRYERKIRPNFDRDFQRFLDFLVASGLGQPRVTQCEVTYVNHVIAGEGWESFTEAEKVFAFWRQPVAVPPGLAEDFRVHARFPIPGPDGSPVGRLHADVMPAVRVADQRKMFVFQLTARGMEGEGTDFFDRGRAWIVKAFKALTTPHMHEIWRIKQ